MKSPDFSPTEHQQLFKACGFDFSVAQGPDNRGEIKNVGLPAVIKGGRDMHPAVSVNVYTGVFKDHGGHGSGNIFQAIQKVHGLTGKDADKWVASIIGTGDSSPVPIPVVRQEPAFSLDGAKKWNADLFSDDTEAQSARHYLNVERGLTDETLKHYHIGLRFGHKVSDKRGKGIEGWWIVFPTKVEGDKVMCFKAFLFDPDNGSWKLQDGKKEADSRGSCLYPIEDAKAQKGTIYLCEGEIDCLTARQLGYNALTGTAGASTWKPEWTQEVVECNPEKVIILYDPDEAGQKGREKVASALTEAGIVVEIANLQADVNETIRQNPEVFRKAVESSTPFEPHESVREQFILDCMRKDERGDGILYAYIRRKERLYDYTARTWRRFRRGVWEKDETEQTLHEFPGLVSDAYLALSKQIDDRIVSLQRSQADAQAIKELVDHRDSLRSRARSLNKAARVKNAAAFAARELPTTALEFDSNPYLLNVENGTYDLKRDTFREHRASDKLSKITRIVYDPSALCPRFIEFINKIFRRDDSLINFIQMVVGYCLTGLTDLDLLLFCYGTGANGKSTFFSVLKNLLGDYYRQIPINTLLSKQYGGSSDDYHLASLFGARCVVASEIPEGRSLNESLVKDLTGGDQLSARNPYEKPFSFDQTHKLWIFGNHKPVINGTDAGIWRRVRLIPFEVTIPKEEQVDRSLLLAQLRSELPGILNWAIAGYRKYREERLDFPEAIKTATSSYREESDVLGAYITERCVQHPSSRSLAQSLYKDYKDWAGQNEESAINYRQFTATMRERGFEVKPGTNNKSTVYGIGLRAESVE